MTTQLPPSVEDFTVPEKILLAADGLEKEGQSPFSAEALVVAAWQRFPRSFGLKGYVELYPDSNKVLSSLMGEKGLARKGLLSKMGQKLYALTRDGRAIVRQVLLSEETAPALSEHQRLGHEEERVVRHLLDSTAVLKFEENRKSELAFADACRFWDITENMRADVIDAKVKLVETHPDLDRQLTDADAELTSGRILSAGDVRVLSNIHHFMKDRFDRHLNLLRSRTASRR